MMSLVTGPPGTGKTLYSVRKNLRSLQTGCYVASNVQLEPGWALVFARENYIDRILDAVTFSKGKRVKRKAAMYERRTFISGDLSELFALRLPRCEKCKACRSGKRTCQREGRGKMILDEAHEWLNARSWDLDDTGEKVSREEAVRNRLGVVKFFALHRKLGWDVFLITQSEKRLDNQVRDNFEYHVRLKNMRKFKLWGLFPIVPFNWFFAITFWHASGGERVGLESYLLNRKIADCYDTMARPEAPAGVHEHAAIHLPLSDEDREARERGEWSRPGSEPEEATVGGGSAAEGSAGRSPRDPASIPAPVPLPPPAGAPGSARRPPWVR